MTFKIESEIVVQVTQKYIPIDKSKIYQLTI